jgi:hypothetical protein
MDGMGAMALIAHRMFDMLIVTAMIIVLKIYAMQRYSVS